jgi:hypothetical protein
MMGSGEPTRLHSRLAAGSALGRAIEAAQGCGPSDEQLKALEQSVLAVVGAAAVLAGASKAAHTIGSASWLSAGSTKLVTVLVAAVGVGSGVGVAWYRARPATYHEASVSPPVRARTTVLSVQPLAEAIAPNLAAPSLATPTRAVGKAKAVAKAPAPPPSEPAHETSDEIALLERANRTLAASPPVALSLIEEHERRFPLSPLDQERELITVTALVRLDRIAEARQLADRFAHRYPGSAYVGRIQGLVESRK